jgi:hypothetical protein
MILGYILITDMFGTTSIHQLQLSFANHLPNTPNFASSASPKKCKVSPNFNIFMKQQNRCFTNRYFELPRKVEVKLPAIVTGYIKMVCSIFSLTLHTVTCAPPRPAPTAMTPFAPIRGSTVTRQRWRGREPRRPTRTAGRRPADSRVSRRFSQSSRSSSSPLLMTKFGKSEKKPDCPVYYFKTFGFGSSRLKPRKELNSKI